MENTSNTIEMRVTSIRDLTSQVKEFVLCPSKQITIPNCEPGAHITVQTPSGAMRRYSLVCQNDAQNSYTIAVKREPASRGGSVSMHEQVHEDTALNILPPENSFPLNDAPEYLLIAGGIGITPIFSMARKLKASAKPFRIIYCTRSAEETPYLSELTAEFGDRLTVHHDGGDPDKVFDFWDIFATPQNFHVYCCGPKPLMTEIKAISGHWPEGRVNFEDFKPVEVVRADDVAFNVILQKSDKVITVPEDKTILEALRDAGVSTTSSCESGTCGTCKTRFISGNIDHRDMVLMNEEKSNFIMICVSRAKSGDITLDL